MARPNLQKHSELRQRARRSDAGVLKYDPKERFWSRALIGLDSECWHWKGRKNLKGYGLMTIGGQQRIATHWALEFTGKPRPDDAHALHACDNPSCVNPLHLRWGKQADNTADMITRRRHVFGARCAVAKLTDDQAIAIYKDKRPQKIIADEYGISPTSVSLIKSGKIWKLVTSATLPAPTRRATHSPHTVTPLP